VELNTVLKKRHKQIKLQSAPKVTSLKTQQKVSKENIYE